jgi:RHS repeat-associated protein
VRNPVNPGEFAPARAVLNAKAMRTKSHAASLAAAAVAVTTLLHAGSSTAQQAPLDRAGAGRGGAASPVGGLGEAIDLALPPERHDLPIPIAITHVGGATVGEAGAGWAIAPTYVSRNTGYSRQRPSYLTGVSGPTSPQDRDLARTTVVLAGRAIVFTSTGPGEYTPIVDDQDMHLTQQGSAWQLTDGHGHGYRFETIAGLGTPQRWYLTEVRSDHHAQSKVTFSYRVASRLLIAATAWQPEVRASELYLDAIRYDYAADASCAKHEIAFGYGPDPTRPPPVGDVARPLDYEIDEGAMRVRTELLTSVDVTARPGGCGLPQRLARYTFRYAADQDTGAPRLIKVDLLGRDGTAEAGKAAPVRRYWYGSMAHHVFPFTGAALWFADSGTIAMPGAMTSLGLAALSTNYTITSFDTQSTVLDLDGDGLPDLLSGANVARNLGGTSFAAPAPLFGALTGTLPPLDATSTSGTPGWRYGLLDTGHEDTAVSAIDFNGDGRTDFLDTRQDLASWKLYLNEPSGWRTLTLDIRNLRYQLSARGHSMSGPMPVRRSTTAQTRRMWSCWTGDLTSASSYPTPTPAPCPNTAQYLEAIGPQTTRVEWELRDVNGDGYPDLVADTRPTQQIITRPDTNPVCDIGPYGPGTHGCYSEASFSFVQSGPNPAVDDNQLIVFYNRAGAQLGLSNAIPFADPTALGTERACAVEEWRSDSRRVEVANARTGPGGWLAFGDIDSAGSAQSCGFVDLNGDGLADRLERGGARLGTGVGYVAIATPPAMGRAIAYVASDRDAVCNAPGATDATLFTETQTDGYLDLNGDGIVDSVSISNVVLGGGSGITSPTMVPASFALSRSRVRCDGTRRETIAGLYDLNGDGRPDFVERDPTLPQLHVYQLTNMTAQAFGAPAAGRLTAVYDGQGSVLRATYASIKGDTRTAHAVPFPEIVLASTQVYSGGMPVTEPTTYAYGGARMWFDWVIDRWTFRGYERTIAVRGLPAAVNDSEGAHVLGTADVTDTWQPWHFGAAFDRNLLVGRVRRTYRLAGYVPTTPAVLLDKDLAVDARWVDQTDTLEATAGRPLGGYVASDECTAAEQPYGLITALSTTNGDYDKSCHQLGLTYPKVAAHQHGTAGPPAAAHVETRDEIQVIDELGRPRTILHFGDTHVASDDTCEVVDYATPSTGYLPVDDAATSIRILKPVTSNAPTCAGATVVLAADRYAYDGLAAGQVGFGRLITHDLELHSPLDVFGPQTWTVEHRYYDSWGNPWRIDRDAGGNKLRTTALTDYDAFGLAPARRTESSSDTAAIETRVVRDPYTLNPDTLIDANGVTRRTYRDGYGRPVRSTLIDPAEGIEDIASITQYLGDPVVAVDGPAADAYGPTDDTLDPLGRRIFERTWHDRAAASGVTGSPTGPTAIESWRTTALDSLGRVRATTTSLGSDYAGAQLASEREYDTLGRLIYQSDPHAGGAASYGTSLVYRADDVVACQVRGRGYTTQTQSSPASALFATCSDERYDQFQHILRTRGPTESDPSATTYGSYDETVADALGRPRSQSRKQVIGALTFAVERMDLGYDPLGYQASITRYGNPSASAPTVTWSTASDSLGHPMLISAPGAATRVVGYDHAFNKTDEMWQDGSVGRAIHDDYDGLGRPIRSATRANSVENVASVVNYFYDETSGEAFHRDTAYAKGRLTHAHAASQSVYVGYDALGNTTFSAWVDGGGRRVEQTRGYRLDGDLRAVGFGVPDNANQAEVATYAYDSAQRLRTIRWRDEVTPAGKDVFAATTIDPLGRYRATALGNGTTQTYAYRDADRNELVAQSFTAQNGVRTTSYGYDDALRMSSRTDNSTYSNRHQTLTYAYDAANRLSSATTRNSKNLIAAREAYAYDGLGNITSLADDYGDRDYAAVPDATDPDRLCRVTGPSWPTVSTGCTFTYDARGNVREYPSGPLTRRRMTYDDRGRAARIEQLSLAGTVTTTGTYQYDPFGGIATLDVGSASTVNRHDVRFGPSVEESVVRDNLGNATSVFERRVPAPWGTALIKRGHGASASYLYVAGEDSGARVVIDNAGRVVQEFEYRPFGAQTVATPTADTLASWKYQWNGGDDLTGTLGVDQVGARIYDPQLGRFLQRDPLQIPRGAGQLSPYGFAWNDPVNRRDPTGMDPEGVSSGGLVSGGAAIALGVGSWLLHHLRASATGATARRATSPGYGPFLRPVVPLGPWATSEPQSASQAGYADDVCGDTSGYLHCDASGSVNLLTDSSGPWDGGDFSLPSLPSSSYTHTSRDAGALSGWTHYALAYTYSRDWHGLVAQLSIGITGISASISAAPIKLGTAHWAGNETSISYLPPGGSIWAGTNGLSASVDLSGVTFEHTLWLPFGVRLIPSVTLVAGAGAGVSADWTGGSARFGAVAAGARLECGKECEETAYSWLHGIFDNYGVYMGP